MISTSPNIVWMKSPHLNGVLLDQFPFIVDRRDEDVILPRNGDFPPTRCDSIAHKPELFRSDAGILKYRFFQNYWLFLPHRISNYIRLRRKLETWPLLKFWNYFEKQGSKMTIFIVSEAYMEWLVYQFSKKHLSLILHAVWNLESNNA